MEMLKWNKRLLIGFASNEYVLSFFYSLFDIYYYLCRQIILDKIKD